jgi:hypothetical protein
MRRSNAVAVSFALLLLADVPAFAAKRQAIYVNADLADSDADTRKALSACVERYKAKTRQIDFLNDDSKTAAFAYLRFTVDKEAAASELTTMVMTSHVRIAAPPERQIETDCTGCGSQPIRRLFHDVLEKTLFSGARGLYKPLPVVSCHASGTKSVTITVQRPANGIALEHGIHYGLRRKPAADETGVVLIRDPLADDDLTSTFTISGATTPHANFIKACSSRTAQVYELVPHGRLPGDNSRVNKDVPSATR